MSVSGLDCDSSLMTSISRTSLEPSEVKPPAREADGADGDRVSPKLAELLVVEPDSVGDRVVGRGQPGLGLDRLARALDLAGAVADEARNPIHRAEFIEDRAADSGRAVRLELDLAFEVERVDRVHQPEEPGRHEVLEIHLVGEPRVDAFGVVAHEREEALHEVVAHVLRARLLVLDPDLLDRHVVVRRLLERGLGVLCGESPRAAHAGLGRFGGCHGPLLEPIAIRRGSSS